MPVRSLAPRVKLLAPTSDISAKIPPSPRLSARITNRQYLIETVMISAHTMSERMPMALAGVNRPPTACTTVCSVYSGLVPRSPNTTPRAASLAHCAGCPAAAAASRLDARAFSLDAPHPERRDAIDRRVLGDLKVLSTVGLPARQGCGHGAGDTVGALPAEYRGAAAGRRGPRPCPHRCATRRDRRDYRSNPASNLNRHFYTPRVDSLATIGRRTVALRPGVYFCEAAATIVFSCSMAASSARLRQAPSSPIHCSRG